MSDDRQLLEDAARAAGLSIGFVSDQLAELCFVWNDDKKTSRWWRPEDDDGDSRRLQVALELELRVFNGKAHAGKQDQFWCTETWFPGGDVNAAARMAVLRAAAAIGQKMREAGNG